jgi:hypothetical protein
VKKRNDREKETYQEEGPLGRRGLNTIRLSGKKRLTGKRRPQ